MDKGATAIQIWTLVIAGVAAVSAIFASIVTSTLASRDADRVARDASVEAELQRLWTEVQDDRRQQAARVDQQYQWERDQVTQHYLEVLAAAYDLHHCYVSEVVPVYATTPVGDQAHAWKVLSQAHSAMLRSVTLTLVVARPWAQQVLGHLADIDVSVLAPFARTDGMPAVALARAETEERELVKSILSLNQAMRADLSLAKHAEEESLAATVAGWRTSSQRSLSATYDAAALRGLLLDYRVVPLSGADVGYHMDGTTMSGYQLPLPGLRRPLAALLTIRGEEIRAAVAADLDPEGELRTLQALVRYAESGFRHGPDQRDIPLGGRVALWPR